MSDTSSNPDLLLFQEPGDFYAPDPEPTHASHTLTTGAKEAISCRLVGHNPLWGHYLWNAGRVLANYLELHADSLVFGQNVLECGAGAGLPSLVCALRGAKKIVVTDYPDPDLVENLSHNITNLKLRTGNIVAEGYLWGRPAASLFVHLASPQERFDLLLLSDLLFNHSEHGKLVDTIELTMARNTKARALVFFTPHRPWLYDKDMAFFAVARERGLEVKKILEQRLEKPMFEEDRGVRYRPFTGVKG